MDKLAAAISSSLEANSSRCGPGVSSPAQFTNDFQPFMKTNERVFYPSDWMVKQNKPRQNGVTQGGFSVKAEDDASYSTVEGKQKSRSSLRPRAQFSQRTTNFKKGGPQQNNNNNNNNRNNMRRAGNNNNNNRNRNNNYQKRDTAQRPYSCIIGSHWEESDSIELKDVQSALQTDYTLTTIFNVGATECYDTTYDKIIPSQPRYVVTPPQPYHNIFIPLQDDPYITDIIKDPSNNNIVVSSIPDPEDENKVIEQYSNHTIIMTDHVASILMASPHTVQPWDVVITKTETCTYIDTRPESHVCSMYVDESALDKNIQEYEHINGPLQLSYEATNVQNTVRRQVLSQGLHPTTYDKPMLIPDGEYCAPVLTSRYNTYQQHQQQAQNNNYQQQQTTSTTSNTTSTSNKNSNAVEQRFMSAQSTVTGFSYRRLVMNGLNIIIRCALYAHDTRSSSQLVYTATAFEYNPASHMPWKSNLLSSFAAVFGNEVKNNKPHMQRILAESLISGADQLKLAWISRQTPIDPTRHTILHVSTHKIDDYARMINTRRSELLGALDIILEMVNSSNIGRYVLLREPADRRLTLHYTPDINIDE